MSSGPEQGRERGLDTNVLVRYLLGDDPEQAELARAFIEDDLTPGTPGLVHPVALCELVWVLRQVYKVPKSEIVAALRLVLSVRTLRVLGEPDVREAVDLFESHPADFADCLLAVQYGAAGTGMATFDRDASRLPGARRLGGETPAREAGPLESLRGSVPVDGPQDAGVVREAVQAERARQHVPPGDGPHDPPG